MTQKTIIANWKMNNSFEESENFIYELKRKIRKFQNKQNIIICPPAPLLTTISEIIIAESLENLESKKGSLDNLTDNQIHTHLEENHFISLGAQDCHWQNKGAFTGNISPELLSDCGCSHVILGHSERREENSETSQIIAKKIKAAINSDMIPILCIGEDKKTREDNTHLPFLEKQLNASLENNNDLSQLIIAYEPIWSIGTGVIPTIAQISEVADFIKKQLFSKVKDLQIVYGGSVKAKNSGEILEVKNIDGLLVGSASLDVDEFFKIAQS